MDTPTFEQFRAVYLTAEDLRLASSIIYNALKEAHALNSAKTNIAKTAFEIALKQLV